MFLIRTERSATTRSAIDVSAQNLGRLKGGANSGVVKVVRCPLTKFELRIVVGQEPNLLCRFIGHCDILKEGNNSVLLAVLSGRQR